MSAPLTFSNEIDRCLPVPVSTRALVIALLILGGVACQSEPDAGENSSRNASAPTVVEITAADYAFVAPDTIPVGWVTFRMKNEGGESHHFHLDRLPEGQTFADWREAFQEPADSIMRLVAKGKVKAAEAEAAIDKVTPDWTDPDSLQTHGGVGLLAPGHTGQTTHQVDPGHYVMICVIDAPGGRVHASLGMVAGLAAVDSSADRSRPSRDATVRGAGHEIRMDGSLGAGTQTIGFSVGEVPEGLRGGTDGFYSVWLARLSDTTDVQDLVEWDYQNPAPYESLGGFEYLPPDQTAHLTADLKAGRYAWVWFYDGMDLSGGDEPLVKTFTIE